MPKPQAKNETAPTAHETPGEVTGPFRKRLAETFGRLDDLVDTIRDLEERQLALQATIKAQSESRRIRSMFLYRFGISEVG
jgi:hypothetical protein